MGRPSSGRSWPLGLLERPGAEVDAVTAPEKFAGQRLAWIENAVFDADLQLLPRLVLAAIGFRYLNEKTGDAWPSVARLAGDLGRSETQIRAALRDLEMSGHLTKTSRPGETNRYSPTTPPLRKTEGEGNGKSRGSENRTPSGIRGEGQRNSEEDPLGFPLPNPCETPVRKNCEVETPPSPSSRSSKTKKADAIEADFEAFWQTYPRREAKGAAKKAFAKAIACVDLATIIAGADRYAAERRNEDPKFTKHPATWLRAECWGDEPKQAHVLAENDATGRDRPARFRQSSSGQSYAQQRFQEAARSARTEAEHDASFNTIEGEVAR